MSINIQDLGRVEYSVAHTKMQSCLSDRISHAGPDTLLLCEHPAVYTIGRHRNSESNVLFPGAVPVISDLVLCPSKVFGIHYLRDHFIGVLSNALSNLRNRMIYQICGLIRPVLRAPPEVIEYLLYRRVKPSWVRRLIN